MTRIALVTGAAGFIGANVAGQLLASGYEVVGIGHTSSMPIAGMRWQPGDIDAAGLRALGCIPELIVHCAGGSSVARSISAPDEDCSRTLDSARAILGFARDTAPHAALVLVSSAAVYGDARTQPIHEETQPAPVSPYGEHKLAAEALWREEAACGLRTVIVRLFSVYGEGLRKQLLWDACSKLANGEAEFGGTGAERRDWLHVIDAARLLILAAQHAETNCPAVNGGSGEAVQVHDVLTELSVALGAGVAPCFSGLSRPGDPQCYWADISRAHQWGWQPVVDWQSGIRRYVAWFKNQRGP